MNQISIPSRINRSTIHVRLQYIPAPSRNIPSPCQTARMLHPGQCQAPQNSPIAAGCVLIPPDHADTGGCQKISFKDRLG